MLQILKDKDIIHNKIVIKYGMEFNLTIFGRQLTSTTQ